MENKPITLEDLKRMLAEKENMKSTMEQAYQQIIGQLVVIKDLIKKMEKQEEPKNDNV